MIKFAILLCIVLLCGFVGYVISLYFKNRMLIYADIIKMITYFKGEIYFLQTDFKTLLKRQSYGKGVNNVLENYLKTGQASTNVLRHNEVAELTNCLNSIGKKDVDGEINNLNYYESLFQRKFSETKAFYDKYGVLIVKLSIIAGALISVVLM